jgi:hypothetical protein
MEWFENEDFWREFYPFMFSDERFAATPDEVSRILALTQCSGGAGLIFVAGRDATPWNLRSGDSKSQALTVLHFCWQRRAIRRQNQALRSNGSNRI